MTENASSSLLVLAGLQFRVLYYPWQWIFDKSRENAMLPCHPEHQIKARLSH